MKFRQRKLIRLSEYDYSRPGYYFVTICAQNRQHLFGDIIVGAGPCAGPKMRLNDIGVMVQTVWQEMPDHYPGVDIDTFVVMPNHIHGIIVLTGRPRGAAPTSLSLCDVVHRFKSFTTARYRHCVEQKHWPRFPGRLWQRNYWERVIRNDRELDEIRPYIYYNPDMWEDDEYNEGS